jgi:hypothetical protein
MRLNSGKIFVMLSAFILVSFLALSADLFFAHFPVPPEKENSLFYIQRSKNANTIVYDANLKPDGSLDQTNPVKIYWIRYAEDSLIEPLSYIQQKYAYGLKTTPYPGKPGQFILTFNSYSKKQFYLLKDTNGKHFSTYAIINGKYAILKKVLIKISGGTFWFPNIDFIELVGKDVATQKPISEKFQPQR